MGNGIARAEAESFLFKAASTDDADAIKGLVLEHHVPVDWYVLTFTSDSIFLSVTFFLDRGVI